MAEPNKLKRAKSFKNERRSVDECVLLVRNRYTETKRAVHECRVRPMAEKPCKVGDRQSRAKASAGKKWMQWPTIEIKSQLIRFSLEKREKKRLRIQMPWSTNKLYGESTEWNLQSCELIDYETQVQWKRIEYIVFFSFHVCVCVFEKRKLIWNQKCLLIKLHVKQFEWKTKGKKKTSENEKVIERGLCIL